MAVKERIDFTRVISPKNKLEQSSPRSTFLRRLQKLPVDDGLVLLTGASGTGKTLAAEVIAQRLNNSLLQVDCRQLISKYIGETEKNLDKVISEAEKKNLVLFFDEADSFFGKRTEVKDSHDRYANQEVSYLLQALERHKGLVILSTNLKSQKIDTVLLRRFRVVLQQDDDDEK